MRKSITPLLLSVLLCLPGCSLLNVELKSDAVPFTEREMNTRLRLREFAKEFSRAVESTADSILQSKGSSVEHQVSALTWKISATVASRNAIFQTIPSVAAVDTWVLCRQMDNLMTGPKGSAYFGEWQPLVAQTTTQLNRSMDRIAQQLAAPEAYQEARTFVEGYADSVRFSDLSFQRDPIYASWNEYRGIPDSLAMQTVGNLSQAFDNATVQLSDLGKTLPKQSQWQLEIWQKQYGDDTIAVFQTIDSISMAINRISRVTENPEVLDTALLKLRAELVPLLNGMQEQWNYTLYVIGQERVAATDSLKVQGAALMVGIDSLSTRVVDRAVQQVMDGIPAILRNAALLVIVVTLALVGIPFILGGNHRPAIQAAENLTGRLGTLTEAGSGTLYNPGTKTGASKSKKY